MKSFNFPPVIFQQSVKLFFSLCIFFFFGFQNFAQGDLLIYPKRITFEGTQNRVQLINLNNKGQDSARYQLSYIENRMKEDGKFEIVESPDPGQLIASPYLRFYPRIITLAPNETQVIKIQLVRTSELAPGEYRSHLYFRPIKDLKAIETIEIEKEKPEGISLSLEPVYGISVANIIRIGKPQAKIHLSNLNFEIFNASIPIISMDFNRSGNASSYGDLKVLHISPAGKETIVGELKGFAVYTPGILRKARMKLKVLEEVNYKTGTLVLSYTSQETKKLCAEASLDL